MFYMIFDLMMAVIMLLFGVWFYKSEGRAAKFLSGYNMKSEEERKKYDENAMCKAYGKRMMFMSVPFILGTIVDIQHQGIGCLISTIRTGGCRGQPESNPDVSKYWICGVWTQPAGIYFQVFRCPGTGVYETGIISF